MALLSLQIADLVELQWLVHLQNLHTLWLSDNPCAELPHYRAQVGCTCSVFRGL